MATLGGNGASGAGAGDCDRVLGGATMSVVAAGLTAGKIRHAAGRPPAQAELETASKYTLRPFFYTFLVLVVLSVLLKEGLLGEKWMCLRLHAHPPHSTADTVEDSCAPLPTEAEGVEHGVGGELTRATSLPPHFPRAPSGNGSGGGGGGGGYGGGVVHTAFHHYIIGFSGDLLDSVSSNHVAALTTYAVRDTFAASARLRYRIGGGANATRGSDAERGCAAGARRMGVAVVCDGDGGSTPAADPYVDVTLDAEHADVYVMPVDPGDAAAQRALEAGLLRALDGDVSADPVYLALLGEATRVSTRSHSTGGFASQGDLPLLVQRLSLKTDGAAALPDEIPAGRRYPDEARFLGVVIATRSSFRVSYASGAAASPADAAALRAAFEAQLGVFFAAAVNATATDAATANVSDSACVVAASAAAAACGGGGVVRGAGGVSLPSQAYALEGAWGGRRRSFAFALYTEKEEWVAGEVFVRFFLSSCALALLALLLWRLPACMRRAEADDEARCAESGEPPPPRRWLLVRLVRTLHPPLQSGRSGTGAALLPGLFALLLSYLLTVNFGYILWPDDPFWRAVEGHSEAWFFFTQGAFCLAYVRVCRFSVGRRATPWLRAGWPSLLHMAVSVTLYLVHLYHLGECPEYGVGISFLGFPADKPRAFDVACFDRASSGALTVATMKSGLFGTEGGTLALNIVLVVFEVSMLLIMVSSYAYLVFKLLPKVPFSPNACPYLLARWYSYFTAIYVFVYIVVFFHLHLSSREGFGGGGGGNTRSVGTFLSNSVFMFFNVFACFPLTSRASAQHHRNVGNQVELAGIIGGATSTVRKKVKDSASAFAACVRDPRRARHTRVPAPPPSAAPSRVPSRAASSVAPTQGDGAAAAAAAAAAELCFSLETADWLWAVSWEVTAADPRLVFQWRSIGSAEAAALAAFPSGRTFREYARSYAHPFEAEVGGGGGGTGDGAESVSSRSPSPSPSPQRNRAEESVDSMDGSESLPSMDMESVDAAAAADDEARAAAAKAVRPVGLSERVGAWYGKANVKVVGRLVSLRGSEQHGCPYSAAAEGPPSSLGGGGGGGGSSSRRAPVRLTGDATNQNHLLKAWFRRHPSLVASDTDDSSECNLDIAPMMCSPTEPAHDATLPAAGLPSFSLDDDMDVSGPTTVATPDVTAATTPRTPCTPAVPEDGGGMPSPMASPAPSASTAATTPPPLLPGGDEERHRSSRRRQRRQQERGRLRKKASSHAGSVHSLGAQPKHPSVRPRLRKSRMRVRLLEEGRGFETLRQVKEDKLMNGKMKSRYVMDWERLGLPVLMPVVAGGNNQACVVCSDALITMSFRGTVNLANVRSDLRACATSLTPHLDPFSALKQAGRLREILKFGGAVSVHSGFLDIWNNNLRGSVVKHLIRMMVREGSEGQSIAANVMRVPKRRVYVTGHSLGGALASLCAFDVSLQVIHHVDRFLDCETNTRNDIVCDAHEGYCALKAALQKLGWCDTVPVDVLSPSAAVEGEAPPTQWGSYEGIVGGADPTAEREVVVYTFGSPKVGNGVWKRAYNEAVPHTYRIVNGEDAVPGMPPDVFGTRYKHVGQLVLLSPQGDLRINPKTIERSLSYTPLIPSSASYDDHLMRSYRESLVAVGYAYRKARSVTFTNDFQVATDPTETEEGAWVNQLQQMIRHQRGETALPEKFRPAPLAVPYGDGYDE